MKYNLRLVEYALINCSRTNFKLALKSGLYDFINARDFYRDICEATGVGMHRDVFLRYVELQTLLLAVVAPHWSEYIWLEVLKKVRSVKFTIVKDKKLTFRFSPSPFRRLLSLTFLRRTMLSLLPLPTFAPHLRA